MEVGGWVQVSLGILFCEKSSQNSPKPVLIFWSSIPRVFCLYTLLKVVSYYDLKVLSMPVMGFHKKKSLDGGWVDGVSPKRFFFGICLTLQIQEGRRRRGRPYKRLLGDVRADLSEGRSVQPSGMEAKVIVHRSHIKVGQI